MPARTTLLLGALLLTSVGLSGCTKSSGRASAPSASSTTTSTTLVAGPQLTTDGSEPRVVLRFHLTAGTKEEVEITTDLGVSEDGPAGPQTVDPPPVVQTLQFRVGKVGSDGTAQVSYEVVDAVVGRGNALTAAEQMTYTAALAGLRGLRGSGSLSAQGELRNVRLSTPPDAGPSVRAQIVALRTQITRLTPTLPTGPVGVGGSWTSEDTTSLGGATVTQSVTTTVTAIVGDQISYRSTTRSTAARQPLALTGLPAGTTATLTSSELDGTGDGTLNLATIGATSSTKAAGTQVIEVKTGDAPPTSTTQRVTVTTRSEPKP